MKLRLSIQAVIGGWSPSVSLWGLEKDEFKAWRDLFLTSSDAILLVEGETDKEYFELLRDPAHGPNQLKFDGDIVSYDGTGSLRNTVLLRFVKNRHGRMFVTFDMDAEGDLEKSLKALGLEKQKHYWPIGVDSAGKKNIEGLLPDEVTKAVYNSHPDAVQALMSGTTEERNAARDKLKKLLLREFKAQALPGDEYYGRFYPIVKMINRALSYRA